MREIETSQRWDQRGSALVLVLLILLALTAIGMVALKDVNRSIQQSGQYRVRAQAAAYADAVGQFMAKRTGDKANEYWNMMETTQDFDLRTNSSMDNRKNFATRGAFFELTQDPDNADDEKKDFRTLFDMLGGDESGLFVGSSGERSFESRHAGSEFSVIIRDPVDGIPAPGYSNQFCFKKVTIAARAQLGELSDSWTQPRQVGVGRTVAEGLIGPMDCGGG